MDGIRFDKVSFDQYLKDNTLKDSAVAMVEWANIKLPQRATKGSAGYDFFAPCDIDLEDGQTAYIYTGIRCEMPKDVVLLCFPKSGLGSKYGLQFKNSTGVVDSDYSFSENEGHILAVIINDNRRGESLHIPAGKAFFQGVFLPYFVTEDDEAEGIRNGGYGSTGV